MFFARKSFQRTFAAVAVLTLFVIGCGSDDPMSEHEEHFEPDGLVLIESGNRFFRYFEGADRCQRWPDAGHLEVPNGGLTAKWSIMFLGPRWRRNCPAR